MRPLKVYPNLEEVRLLDRISSEDLRTHEATLRWLIRQEAERRGIILTDPDPIQPVSINLPTPELEAPHGV